MSSTTAEFDQLTSPDIVAKKAGKIKKNSDSKPIILYVPNPDEKYIFSARP